MTGERLYTVEATRALMGTDVGITVIHPEATSASRAVDRAFNTMYRVEDLMSIRRDDSELSQLNRDGYREEMSLDTLRVIQEAQTHSKLSGGAFDITVLPLLELWMDRVSNGQYPSTSEIRAKLSLVDYRSIRVKDRAVQFDRTGMKITLEGLAKGYAVDKAVECLKGDGIKHALVNAGGDIRALGCLSNGSPWRIAVRNPADKRQYITVIELEDKAVSTSGSYEKAFSAEAEASHIVDPKTGYPARKILSATIVAGRATDADALATALFVAGEEGVTFVKEACSEALIVDRSGKILRLSPEA